MPTRRAAAPGAAEPSMRVRRSIRMVNNRIDTSLLALSEIEDEEGSEYVATRPHKRRRKLPTNQNLSTTDSTSSTTPSPTKSRVTRSDINRQVDSAEGSIPKGNRDTSLVNAKRKRHMTSQPLLEHNGSGETTVIVNDLKSQKIERRRRGRGTSSRLSVSSSDSAAEEEVEDTSSLLSMENDSSSLMALNEWNAETGGSIDDDRVAKEVKMRYSLAHDLRAEVGTEEDKSLLEQLLDQSDKYTAYMLARSLAPQDTTKEVFREDENSSAVGPRRARGYRSSRRDKEEEFLLHEVDEELAGHQSFWTRLSQQPAIITGGTLKPYQLEGLNWLVHLYESGLNGILADEMGLGKTLQTIALLAYLKESRGISGPHLILAPKSTLGNWIREINRFCPNLKAYNFHGNKEERTAAKLKGELTSGKYDIIVTSYELCMKEQSLFRNHYQFRYIVVDEAHRIKNEASKLSKTIRTFKTQFRLLLTGTPLQNNLKELWSLLNFLFPEMFASSEEFDRMFDLRGNFDDATKSLTPEEKSERNSAIVSRLHKILKPFLLRRVKSEVMVELPPKKELLLYVPLSSMQRSLYKDLLARNVDAINDAQGGGRVRLLNLAMQLRKACNHPYLFEGYEDKSLDPFGEHLIINSGKMRIVDRLLQQLIARGSRTLIFTQMTRMLDILEDYCRMREFIYCRIDGSTLGEDREKQLEQFNAPDSLQTIFLLSTRAGGLGINLATADTVILFDSDWNPQVDLQAMDRAHRIGQKKPVNVYRLIHEHTIEEKIIERAMLKLRLDTAVIQQGRLSDRHSHLNKSELMRMIQFGADQIYKSKNTNEMTDEDIENILSRGEKWTQELSGKLQSHLQTRLLDFDFSTPSVYEFEGVDYNESQRHADKHAWAEMGVTALDEERNAKRRVRVVQEQLEEIQRQQQFHEIPQIDKKGKKRYVKLPKMEDWQFYDRERILELHELEVQYIASNGVTEEPTVEERAEKQKLLSEGFDWNRKDILNFIKACETYGLSDSESIAKEMGKDMKEIERYSKIFLERYTEVLEGEKWLKKIKLGDNIAIKKKQFEDILIKKLSNGSWRYMCPKFPKSKSHFSDEEDVWLLNATLDVGYGNWDQLQAIINQDSYCMFNWFLKSRTPLDIGRRIEFLIKQIQRESLEETSTRSKAKEVDISEKEITCLYPSLELMYGSTIKPITSQGRGFTPKRTRKPLVKKLNPLVKGTTTQESKGQMSAANENILISTEIINT